MNITLRPKIMVGVLGPLAVVLALFAYIQYNEQRSLLLDATARTATDLNDVIEGGLQYAMLTRNRAEIQASINDIAANAPVVDLFLLNTKSKIRAGFPQALRGQSLSQDDPGCAVCHAPDAPHRGELSVVLTLPEVGRVLRSCNPIENKAACHKCHEPDQPYNGVLITDLTLDGVEQAATNNLERILFLLGGALLLGAALLGITMERSVIQPLSQLTASFATLIMAIYGGGLPSPATVTKLVN